MDICSETTLKSKGTINTQLGLVIKFGVKGIYSHSERHAGAFRYWSCFVR